MERDHAKEKQKLLKDKDAGTRAISHLLFKNLVSYPSYDAKPRGS